jgi:hypothetical protein
MRRFLGITATALVALAAGGIFAAGSAAAAAPAGAACVTAQPIQIDSFVFVPRTVAPGGTSRATLTSQNCTGKTQTVQGTWFGVFTRAVGTNPPPGCPVIDPLSTVTLYPPGATLMQGVSYTVPASCKATDLAVTVRLSIAGTVVATATAHLGIIQPTS